MTEYRKDVIKQQLHDRNLRAHKRWRESMAVLFSADLWAIGLNTDIGKE